ncbi:glycosyltransferase, partial [Liquorilactobacillus vini]
MKLLTISIAAYNVEKYLDKCLNSLNDDRFKNDIEVLVIDDGSHD